MAVASPWCCDEQANTKNCIWAGIDHGKLADCDDCQNARKCPNNYVEIGEDFAGGNWPDCMTVQSCTPSTTMLWITSSGLIHARPFLEQ